MREGKAVVLIKEYAIMFVALPTFKFNQAVKYLANS